MRGLGHLLVIASMACVWSASTLAQNKTGGSNVCAKPDPSHVLPAGDRPDHSLGVEQMKCTWPKPFEIGTDKAKESVATETMEISGNRSHVHGMHVVTMESGDKVFVSYQGAGTMKDGKAVEAKGTWSITGGTGKHKGLTGKGTYSCAPSGDTMGCSGEGEYTPPK
jgi:hypothetical protein